MRKKPILFLLFLLSCCSNPPPSPAAPGGSAPKKELVLCNSDSVYRADSYIQTSGGRFIKVQKVINGCLHEAVTDTVVTDWTVYHSIAVPKGMHYKIVVGTGAVLWLAAGSTLYFPIGSTGVDLDSCRLNGRIFLQVIQPFRCRLNGWVICGKQPVVFSFYNNAADTDIEVLTVVKGKLTASNGKLHGILTPDELNTMAVNVRDTTCRRYAVAADAAGNWIDGGMVFDNASYGDIVEQVGNWFALAPLYRKEYNTRGSFTGTMKGNLGNVLRLLQSQGMELAVLDKTITIKKTK